MHPRISIRGCVHPSVRLSVYLSIHLSVCPPFSQNQFTHSHTQKKAPLTIVRCVLPSLYEGKCVCPSGRPAVHPSLIFSKSVYALPHAQKPPLTIIRCVLASLFLDICIPILVLSPILPTSTIQFLVADMRLYALPCWTVGRSSGRPVGPLHFLIPGVFHIIASAQLSATVLPCIWPCSYKQGRIHGNPVADG